MAGFMDAVPIGVLHINGHNHGWAEKVILKTAGSPTLGSAQAAMALYVPFRQIVMAAGYQIVWARASMGDTSRATLRAIDAPLDPKALSTEGGGITFSNDVKSACHIRLETATGRWSNRLVRGLRDGWISANALNSVTPTVPGTVVPGTDDQAGLTAAVAFGNFIRALLQYTRHVEESDTHTAILTDWATYNIRGITAHDTGRPFGSGKGRRSA